MSVDHCSFRIMIPSLKSELVFSHWAFWLLRKETSALNEIFGSSCVGQRKKTATLAAGGL